MPVITVALLQMASHGFDQQANLQKGEAFCREAARMGADIALFPEMWNIGYKPFHSEVWDLGYDPQNPQYPELLKEWQERAVAPDDPFLKRFLALAGELNMAIAVTYLEKYPGAPRNAMTLFDRHGRVAMTYAKVHTCEWSLEAACTPGDDFYVCTLDTEKGPVKVGTMICFDREFPESARVLMLRGAEVILVPNACPMDQNRTNQLQARAYENMVGIALANYVEDGGNSVAFDGMAYTPDERVRDHMVVQAGRDEGVFLARFDLDAMRVYRCHEVWGNAFRKPSCYGILTSPEVEEPFRRKDARR